jgi:hypothetical protein
MSTKPADNHTVSEGVRRCQAFNSERQPCSAQPQTNSLFCFWHDPEKETERRLAVTKGGLSGRPRPLPTDTPNPALRSPRDVIELMEQTSGAVLRGDLAPQLANAAAYNATVALKAMEIEISDRLDKLERSLKGQPKVVR